MGISPAFAADDQFGETRRDRWWAGSASSRASRIAARSLLQKNA
ncbi:hypothetical protein PCL1606_25050 [Pseudomonas chlororaphis]|uniref:Uncharacterized protein n=1 Tax=Pseudomonas chlororaphis TaxID=587753 RepID=A0A0D5XXZ4_9PSED|nr:hypothetical protein PCL1606_25050 [Pseudomonas chlororaphis]